MTVIPFPYRQTHDSVQVTLEFIDVGREILGRLPYSRETLGLRFDFTCINIAAFTLFGWTAEEADEDEAEDGVAFKIEQRPLPLTEWEYFYALKRLWEQQIAFFCTLAATAAHGSEYTTPQSSETASLPGFFRSYSNSGAL